MGDADRDEIIERMTAAEAERDRLRQALVDVRALADRGVAWSAYTRGQVRDVCDAALGVTT